jgi:hypothetical protein
MVKVSCPVDDRDVTATVTRTAACLGIAAGLAGCGLSHAAPAAPAPVPLPSAHVLIRQLDHSMHRFQTFGMHGRFRNGHKHGLLTARIAGDKRVEIDFRQGAVAATIRLIDGQSWLRANYALYASHDSPEVASVVASRWIHDDALAADFDPALQASLRPSRLIYCAFTSGMGTLRVKGTATVNGVPAFLISGEGDRPGTAKSRLYVSQTMPRVPLRYVQNGRVKPGAPALPRCGESAHDRSPAASDDHDAFDFTQFGDPLTIAAPRHPLVVPPAAAST